MSHAIRENDLKHEVLHNIDILEHMGYKASCDSLEAWLDPSDDRFAEDILARHNVRDNDRIIAIGPYAKEAKRQWPLERYAEIADWLVDKFRARVLVIGGQEDMGTEHLFRQHTGEALIFSVGKTSLRQTTALLKHCQPISGTTPVPCIWPRVYLPLSSRSHATRNTVIPVMPTLPYDSVPGVFPELFYNRRLRYIPAPGIVKAPNLTA